MKINGNDPSHPTTGMIYSGNAQLGDIKVQLKGMNIRTEIASRNLAGLLASPNFSGDLYKAAVIAVEGADQLIEALNDIKT